MRYYFEELVAREFDTVCSCKEQQAKQGKVPDELVERLNGILGHIMRPNTLKVRWTFLGCSTTSSVSD